MTNMLQGINSTNKKIVLHVISAYGFGLVKGSIAVYATLTNKQLGTPIIPVNNNELKIYEEMTWYLDTHTLKKLKMSNTSVRIECIHLPANKSSSNERLGYLLFKVKEAQTVNPASHDRVENKSYKLIGSKNCSYSLTMSLRIEDINLKTIKTSSKQIKHSQLINNKNINYSEKEESKSFEECKNVEENYEIDLLKNDVNIMLEQTEHLPAKTNSINVFTFDVQQKVIEEFEDWKNKQIYVFNEKMKIKEEQLLKKFNEKWLQDKKHIEEDLIHEISKCRALAENVEKMADMLKEREAIVTVKELELVCQKDSIDNKYIGLVQNLQSSNGQIINELNNKIFELTTKLQDSEKVNILLKKENEQLKNDLNTNCGFQIQHLENTISNLESKCAEANQSSMFFKERWITSVRKINQISSKLYGNKTNEYLLNKRQNIQNILTNQLVERKQDEDEIKKLLSKLQQEMTIVQSAELDV